MFEVWLRRRQPEGCIFLNLIPNLARIEAKGVSQMQWAELVQWIDLMRRVNGPVIFGTGDWGLANETLAETAV